mmetsp:Transcript_14799/g.24913  ORF Transcript_14799/g.24913 Transcript_14799/m.24913 type:complete len:84 (-) Transcript_14799:71-322(-)
MDSLQRRDRNKTINLLLYWKRIQAESVLHGFIYPVEEGLSRPFKHPPDLFSCDCQSNNLADIDSFITTPTRSEEEYTTPPLPL